MHIQKYVHMLFKATYMHPWKLVDVAISKKHLGRILLGKSDTICNSCLWHPPGCTAWRAVQWFQWPTWLRNPGQWVSCMATRNWWSSCVQWLRMILVQVGLNPVPTAYCVILGILWISLGLHIIIKMGIVIELEWLSRLLFDIHKSQHSTQYLLIYIRNHNHLLFVDGHIDPKPIPFPMATKKWARVVVGKAN